MNRLEPFDPDALDTEQGTEWRAVIALRERNSARIQRIEQLGLQVDVQPARMDHLLSALLALGKITTDEFIQINKDWELHLRGQTKPILQEAEVRHAEYERKRRAAQIAQTGRTDSGLIVPPSAAGATDG